MKHISILIITLVGLFSSAFAQNIDWVNAPLNPIPIGVNLKKTQLKGDVFQDNFTYYDINGKWLDLEKRETISYDQLNRPISITYPGGKIKEYKYDTAGNLIYDNGIVYKYDQKNRLTKAIFAYETIEYTYEKEGKTLIITKISKSPTGGLKGTQKEYYKNGLLVARNAKKDSDKTLFIYEYDTQGNWIKRVETGLDGKQVNSPFVKSIIYHSEYSNFDKNAVLKKTTGDLNLKGGLAIPHLYINGKLDNTNLYNKFNNDYIFYNPLSSKYYLAFNAFNDTIAINQNIPFKPLIEGENILISDGKTALLIEQGTSTLFSYRKWTYEYKYQNIIAKDTKSDDVYFAENAFDNVTNKTKAYPASCMTTKENEVWYIPTSTKEGVDIYDKGIVIKNAKVSGKIVGTEDFVFSINGKPTYVLSNFSNSKPKLFNKGRYFNTAVDKISNTSNTNSNTSQNKSSNTACIAGNCIDGYGTFIFESGAQITGFFKNSKANGFAELTLSSGNSYTGNFYNGLRNGYGIYHFKESGDIYYGHWKDNIQHGYGYFVNEGETVQAGIYSEGKLVTNLLTDFSNGKSNGNCLGNCINGYGSITYDQGDVYEGFFKKGQPYKAGTYMWTKGNSYMGDWDDLGKINNSGQFFTSSFVYKGDFTHNGFITGLGVKLDKKTNVITYGKFKEGNLVVDYNNGHTSSVTTTNNSTASKQAEKAMITAANELINLYYKSNSEFKKIVVNQHNNFAQTMSIDKLNKLHALFIKHLFLIDKVVAHRYLLYLPNPYSNTNTGKILAELSNEERTFIREESKRISSQYKLKEQYVPKN